MKKTICKESLRSGSVRSLVCNDVNSSVSSDCDDGVLVAQVDSDDRHFFDFLSERLNGTGKKEIEGNGIPLVRRV